VTERQIAAGERNTIDHWARRGVAGRAVVFDMVRALRAAGRGFDPGSHRVFEVEDLEIARQQAAVELRAGDIILLYTGFAEWYLDQPATLQQAITRDYDSPGLSRDETMLRYLWNAHVAVIASDNIAVEAAPRVRSDEPFPSLHRMLIGQFGMALGELWWLADLANDCARDGVYETFFSSTPLHIIGGIGSPANAIAIK
jgi:kynurenine formamidase